MNAARPGRPPDRGNRKETQTDDDGGYDSNRANPPGIDTPLGENPPIQDDGKQAAHNDRT